PPRERERLPDQIERHGWFPPLERQAREIQQLTGLTPELSDLSRQRERPLGRSARRRGVAALRMREREQAERHRLDPGIADGPREVHGPLVHAIRGRRSLKRDDRPAEVGERPRLATSIMERAVARRCPLQIGAGLVEIPAPYLEGTEVRAHARLEGGIAKTLGDPQRALVKVA